MTEFDRGMAETAKEMIGDFKFGILEEQSKILLGKFAQVGRAAHATPVALCRETRPTHWLNFPQNLKFCGTVYQC